MEDLVSVLHIHLASFLSSKIILVAINVLKCDKHLLCFFLVRPLSAFPYFTVAFKHEVSKSFHVYLIFLPVNFFFVFGGGDVFSLQLPAWW